MTRLGSKCMYCTLLRWPCREEGSEHISYQSGAHGYRNAPRRNQIERNPRNDSELSYTCIRNVLVDSDNVKKRVFRVWQNRALTVERDGAWMKVAPRAGVGDGVVRSSKRPSDPNASPRGPSGPTHANSTAYVPLVTGSLCPRHNQILFVAT